MAHQARRRRGANVVRCQTSKKCCSSPLISDFSSGNGKCTPKAMSFAPATKVSKDHGNMVNSTAVLCVHGFRKYGCLLHNRSAWCTDEAQYTRRRRCPRSTDLPCRWVNARLCDNSFCSIRGWLTTSHVFTATFGRSNLRQSLTRH